MFWRVHRSFLVNINRIKEVVPWFKSSYQLRMDDKKHTEVPRQPGADAALAGTIQAVNRTTTETRRFRASFRSWLLNGR